MTSRIRDNFAQPARFDGTGGLEVLLSFNGVIGGTVEQVLIPRIDASWWVSGTFYMRYHSKSWASTTPSFDLAL